MSEGSVIDRGVDAWRQVHFDLDPRVLRHAVLQSEKPDAPPDAPGVAEWVKGYRARVARYHKLFPAEHKGFIEQYLAVHCHSDAEAIHMLELKHSMYMQLVASMPRAQNKPLTISEADRIVGSYITEIAFAHSEMTSVPA